LIGDEEAAFAARPEAFAAIVEAGDDFAFSLFKLEGFVAVAGGIELGPVAEIAGVVHFEEHAGLVGFTGAGGHIDDAHDVLAAEFSGDGRDGTGNLIGGAAGEEAEGCEGRTHLFGSGGLEVRIAPSADFQAAADPAERFCGVGSNFGFADFALFIAFPRFDPGGAAGANENLVGNDLRFLACVFSFHIELGA
jgi:hypothetical protein